jgi:hypothetical protein
MPRRLFFHCRLLFCCRPDEPVQGAGAAGRVGVRPGVRGGGDGKPNLPPSAPPAAGHVGLRPAGRHESAPGGGVLPPAAVSLPPALHTDLRYGLPSNLA